MKPRNGMLFAPEAGDGGAGGGGGGGGFVAAGAAGGAGGAGGGAAGGGGAGDGSAGGAGGGTGGSAPFLSQHINADGSFKEGWTESLESLGLGEHKAAFQKYKTEADFIKGYAHQSKLVGAQGIKVPVEGSPPEVMTEYRRAMGIPTTPEEYKLQPKELPKGVVWDEAKGKAFADKFHKMGIPQEHAAAIVNDYLQEIAGISTAGEATMSTAVENAWTISKGNLQKEYGDKTDDRIQALHEYVGTMQDVDTKDPLIAAALSLPFVIRLMDESLKNLSENPLPGGLGAAVGSMSPGEQADAIMFNPDGTVSDWRKSEAKVEKVKQLLALQGKRDIAKAQRGGK